MNTNSPLVLDDNLVNGHTYSFQFELGNLITNPSVATLQTDIVNIAPDFITSLQVTKQSGIGLLTNYVFVTFTYEGDGSDVVSDVVNSLITAFATGSNDDYIFVAVTDGSPPDNAALASVQAAVTGTVTSVVQPVVSAVDDTTKQVSQNAFAAALPWLVGAVLVVIVVLPVVSKSGLIPKVRVA